ncbi:MAG: hypothetical protein DRJ56_05085 [Thermoprotei archaeon]|nr:MAG: hypothetical protein DRJ56_05085 [Thermoprotei archaeon]
MQMHPLQAHRPALGCAHCQVAEVGVELVTLVEPPDQASISLKVSLAIRHSMPRNALIAER